MRTFESSYIVRFDFPKSTPEVKLRRWFDPLGRGISNVKWFWMRRTLTVLQRNTITTLQVQRDTRLGGRCGFQAKFG